MYNDCWPALGFSIVDYYLKPKAGWYASKHCFAPVSSTIIENGGNLDFVCLNDSFISESLSYSIKWLNCDTNEIKEIAKGNFTMKSNENTVILSIKTNEAISGENSIVFLDIINDGCLISRSRWYKKWINDLTLINARIKTTLDADNNTVTVECVKGVAIGICLDGKFTAEDNFFDMIEGEKRVIRLKSEQKIESIQVYGYNTR